MGATLQMRRSAAFLGLMLILAACQIGSPPCVVTANQGWNDHNFDVDVQQPSWCPVYLNTYGEIQTFQAVVKAGWGESEPSTDLIIEIANANGVLKQHIERAWFLDTSNDFR